ncbi:unnamed protein product [Bubo scandiacus]
MGALEHKVPQAEKHRSVPGYKTSSSPSKHHRKVITNPEKKGFNSQSKRFQYNQVRAPKPGQHQGMELADAVFYQLLWKTAAILIASSSKLDRSCFPQHNPLVHGAQRGEPQAHGRAHLFRYMCFQPKQDFSKGNSSMFQQPIAGKTEEIPTPAPDQYSKQQRFWQTVFMSKTTKGLNLEEFGKWPSPCHYNINDSLLKVSPKGITSCFESKTSGLTRMYRFIPEPATYQPHKPTKEAKKTPFRQKFCLTPSAPTIPPCKDPPSPGPGQWDLVDDKGSPEQDCSCAAFVSNTGRRTERRSQEGFPGPGFSFWCISVIVGAHSPRALGKCPFICSRKRLPALGQQHRGTGAGFLRQDFPRALRSSR